VGEGALPALVLYSLASRTEASSYPTLVQRYYDVSCGGRVVHLAPRARISSAFVARSRILCLSCGIENCAAPSCDEPDSMRSWIPSGRTVWGRRAPCASLALVVVTGGSIVKPNASPALLRHCLRWPGGPSSAQSAETFRDCRGIARSTSVLRH